MKKIILASASPRRRELIKYISDDVTFMSADIDETFNEKLGVVENVKQIALKKAQYISSEVKASDSIIIGVDTIVCCDENVFTKPKDEEDAYYMLESLSARSHSVISAVALICEGIEIVEHEETKVYFSELSKEEIQEYIRLEKPFDKAGGYAVQGRAGVFVEKIEGCYYNIVGLPLNMLSRIIKENFK